MKKFGTGGTARLLLTLLCLFGSGWLVAAPLELTPQEQAWIKAHPQIVFGVDIDWQPQFIRQPDGSMSGIDGDTVKHLNHILGTNIVIEQGPWAELVERLKNREIDGLSSSAVHEERRSFARFSEPYFMVSKTLYVRSGNPAQIARTDDLDGKRIAIQTDNLFDEKLLKALPYSIAIITKPSLETLVAAVLAGEADGFIGSIASEYRLVKLGITQVVPVLQLEPPIPVVFSIRSDWPELVSLIDKGLAAMTPAERDVIRNRWITATYQTGIPWRTVILWSALAALAGLLILLWNWTLKRQVAARTQALLASESKIHRLINYDGLTGLPNRYLLMERLERALAAAHRQPRFGAVILLDIDRFKNINDARSHDFGDRFLVSFGGRLAGLLREEDTLARLAADEFAILLPDLGNRRESAAQRARGILRKIQEDLQTPYCIGDTEEIVVSASMGLSVFPKGEPDEDRASDVMRRTDTALNRAKASGGNRFVFFDESMGAQVEDRYRIENELRHGIAAGELRLFLQAQVDATGQALSAEALVRWQHPERGLLAPGMFIAIAEESDLIVKLGEWVMHEACRLIAEEEVRGRPLHLSVNISPRHFGQAGFVRWLKQVLAETGADPLRLTLEVTEGLVIDDINDVIAKMSELAALGIHFSIDDFGTGYSSLAYLKRLPIHELKIDKTFVQDAPTDADDAALVETILSIARHMNLKVVAEGVETQAQAEFLNQRATVMHQGYLYGKPEPAEEWVARWHEIGTT